MADRIFGDIDGFPEGSSFVSRVELARAGLHRSLQAGIVGGGEEGAESIVLSGGYEDDQDRGEEIIYTGHGGRDPNSGGQIADQEFAVGNKALALNETLGLPVRVIRGSELHSPFAPRSGYEYGGLYRVEDYWCDRGKSGFKVWRFRLVKFSPGAAPRDARLSHPVEELPERKQTTVLRIVRDTNKAKEIKRLYDYACQICGTKLEAPAGPYAEAAHIRPLGQPHSGPDSSDNIICVCPNHHVLFDLGAITIADDLTLVGAKGSLAVRKGHSLNREHIRYHREHCGTQAPLNQSINLNKK